MIITISGNPGSGKSTVAKILLEKLDATRIYAGAVFREMAREKGMTLKEFGDYAKIHPEVDTQIDEQVAAQAREIAATGKTVVVEGRVQFHFLTESLKIYVKVSANVGAQRIWADLQDQEKSKERNESDIISLEQMQKEVAAREERDAQRYIKAYGVDHRDHAQYDLVVDSSVPNAQEIAQEILDFIDAQ